MFNYSSELINVQERFVFFNGVMSGVHVSLLAADTEEQPAIKTVCYQPTHHVKLHQCYKVLVVSDFNEQKYINTLSKTAEENRTLFNRLRVVNKTHPSFLFLTLSLTLSLTHRAHM